ncbi:MAG TPA: hypothetical protein VLU46_17215, partial [Thermoanaerobaculia bacterium]|nr:hypothetical protein [Thermoanaerobaculia bacterium]
TAALALVVSFVAVAAFAHAGHIHNFLGIVKNVSTSQLVVTTRAGQEMSFALTAKTAYVRDGKPASRADLVEGMRVAVHVADDGHTATEVKLGSR